MVDLQGSNVAAPQHVATFPDLSIDSVGTGYTLTATASGLTAAQSAAFDITTAIGWAPQPNGTGDTLYGVWGSSGSAVLARRIERDLLRAERLPGTKGSDVFAVGFGGTVLHRGP